MQTTPSANDSIRVIQIVQGKNLRNKFIDSATTLQTIAGTVILKEGNTIFSCDSATINKLTNVMEAFGNIHINQKDSIHTYSQYLKYIGESRMAYLKKEVRLTDKKGTLYTQDLEYDLKTNIGKYTNGGRVVNGKTVLNSKDGVYYADTKDVYFKKEVHLVDPKYDIKSDSLLYNTQTQLVSFITATYIKSKDGGDIFTSSGTYDLKNGKAFFGNRSIIKDSTRTYVADKVAYDEKLGIAQLEGNAIIKDSVNGYSVLGNQIFANKNNQSFLATRKPVLIFKGEGNDTTFIAADTLFSGVIKLDSTGKKIMLQKDTLHKTMVVDALSDSITEYGVPDSLAKKIVFKNAVVANNEKQFSDSFNAKLSAAVGIEKVNTTATDSSITQLPTHVLETTTAIASTAKNEKIKRDTSIHIKTDSSIRYFLAFHHVRIFNDSLQAVCDSLFYSSEDSIFRMYNDPLVFSNKTQIAGDTIHLYTKNKKAERVYVFENSIVINEVAPQLYNQVGGRTMNGYFKDGALDYMRVKGSPAESIFYPKDEDSAITGMNRAKGDLIDVFFVDKAVNKVKFVNDVDGTMYPLRQVPDDQKYLKRFKWLESRRPKNKLELFE